jgi:hypothetical protein
MMASDGDCRLWPGRISSFVAHLKPGRTGDIMGQSPLPKDCNRLAIILLAFGILDDPTFVTRARHSS